MRNEGGVSYDVSGSPSEPIISTLDIPLLLTSPIIGPAVLVVAHPVPVALVSFE